MLLTDSNKVGGHLTSHLLNLEPISKDLSDEGTLRKAKDSFERNYILSALQANDWNITRTAEQLGIARTHFYRKLEKHGISLKSGAAER